MNIIVERESTVNDERTPQLFSIGGRNIRVEQVIDRWLASDHCYFKVSGDDGAIYILHHDLNDNNWDLALYDRNSR